MISFIYKLLSFLKMCEVIKLLYTHKHILQAGWIHITFSQKLHFGFAKKGYTRNPALKALRPTISKE